MGGKTSFYIINLAPFRQEKKGADLPAKDPRKILTPSLVLGDIIFNRFATTHWSPANPAWTGKIPPFPPLIRDGGSKLPGKASEHLAQKSNKRKKREHPYESPMV